MPPANANHGQTIGVAEEIIFQAENAGGTQRRGALELTIINGDTAQTLLVNSNMHHDANEWMPVRPGQVVRLEVLEAQGELRIVKAKRAGGTNVTNVGWGVTISGKGTASA